DSSVFIGLTFESANGKIFECCEWACTLRANGIDGYYGVSLAECEYYTLNYNTMAKNTNSDRSTDFGSFQINKNESCLIMTHVCVCVCVWGGGGGGGDTPWRRRLKDHDIISYDPNLNLWN
uniref:lysozyme n=1 Tax=Astatotilapia calliptera TaxID=8154 RepID=A0A3P8PGX2_ASTCA